MTRLNDKTSAIFARIADLVLRVFPKNTADALRWVITSYGEEDEQEVFHGTGFAARPAAGANAEAIAAAVNGYDHHVIVATRDADTLRRVVDALGLDAGEAMVFSDGVALKCTGTKVLAQSYEGTPASLALKSDVQEIWDYLTLQFAPSGHVHATPSGPSTTVTSAAGATIGEPAGTQVLEAE